jgi:hypothetical protein
VDSGLPKGWTIDRVRRASGDAEASVLSPDRLVTVEDHDAAVPSPLAAEVIIAFHDLCLVGADGEWYMGSLGADGSVACWASYGSELGKAIGAL